MDNECADRDMGGKALVVVKYVDTSEGLWKDEGLREGQVLLESS